MYSNHQTRPSVASFHVTEHDKALIERTVHAVDPVPLFRTPPRVSTPTAPFPTQAASSRSEGTLEENVRISGLQSLLSARLRLRTEEKKLRL